MKILNLQEWSKMNEGIHDKNILKAFILAGSPGAGKSYVTGKLFGLPTEIGMKTFSSETGLKILNQDPIFVHQLQKRKGMSLSDYSHTPEETKSDPKFGAEERQISAELIDKKRQIYLDGRLGVIIEGTGHSVDHISSVQKELSDLGYDVYMIMVNTNLDVALKRNSERERKLPEAVVKEKWTKSQGNIGKYQSLFGRENFIILDNSEYGDKVISAVKKEVNKILNSPIKNPIGRKWIESNSKRK